VVIFGTESRETLVEFPTVWFPKSSKNHPKSSKIFQIFALRNVKQSSLEGRTNVRIPRCTWRRMLGLCRDLPRFVQLRTIISPHNAEAHEDHEGCGLHGLKLQQFQQFPKWGCIKTNLAIFGGMNIHLPVIWGSLGYQGFDSYPNPEAAAFHLHFSKIPVEVLGMG